MKDLGTSNFKVLRWYILVNSTGYRHGKQQNLDYEVYIYHKFTKENIDKVNDDKIEVIPEYARLFNSSNVCWFNLKVLRMNL